MRHTIVAAALLLCSAASQGTAQQQRPIPPDFDRYVARVMEAFDVPGIAVAIVKDGRVVLAKGYGVRTLGQSTPVDAETLFGIASNTKAFTATALGLLVEDGVIAWDAPVVRYLPWFQLSDPWVTRELTVRDLLVHRSGLGLGAGDLLWWPESDYGRAEIARRIRHLPLVTSFRSAYAYDNVLYLIAGEVIEAVSGQSWEDFVSDRILTPVGMTGSTVTHSSAGLEGNVATTHARVEGRVRPIAPFLSDNTNPAGGINSNATDMARWMMVQLDSGRLADGDRLFTPATTRELWSIVTPIPIGTPAPELAPLRANFLGYALGFQVNDYRGRKLISHTGGLPGYVSKVAMIPDLHLGVAVLTNQESGAAFGAISYRVLDHYLGASHDWIDAYRAVATRADFLMASADRQAAAQRDTTSPPSLPLARYAGTYTDAWYGDVLIEVDDDRLRMRFSRTPKLTGTLQHWHHDTFVARWDDRELRADAFVTFQLEADGSIDRVRMRAVSPSTDFSFDFHDLLLRPAERRNP